MDAAPGRGRSARTMDLLWTPPAPRTTADDRRHTLTLDAIVDAATELADAHGTAAVPLRMIGERLGCTAMALYTYVGGKEELLDVMFDRVHAGFTTPPVTSVAAWADRLLDLYVAHPWTLDLAHGRPVLGPHQQEVFESLLGTLLPTVADRRDVAAIASSAFSLSAAAARTVVDARRTGESAGATAGQGWSDRMDALATAAPDFAVRFPLSSVLMAGDAEDSAVPEVSASGDVPIMERAARDNLRRSVELLLAGPGAQPAP